VFNFDFKSISLKIIPDSELYMYEKHWFANKIIAWYLQNGRELPWRNTHNPYFVWISEIILQQTRVKQGLPYYYRFIEKFPTVLDLANAEESEVLRIWQGLGYYSRARNMHFTSKIVCQHFQGVFPETYNDLLKLKGIGVYTAAAIASFSYQEKVAVVDGNVYRVLSRVFNIQDDIASGRGQKYFQQLANELIPELNSDKYNQGIMEFGALFCVPKNPDCPSCVFKERCEAFLTRQVDKLPVKIKKLKIRKRYFNYLVFNMNGSLLMKERLKGDIWQGLYEFLLFEKENAPEEEILNYLIEEKKLSLKNIHIEKKQLSLKHVLTHQILYVSFWNIQLGNETENLENNDFKFYNANEIESLPKPILIENYLNQFFI